MKRVALYGGSFSPPHLGHASIIKSLLRSFSGDEIWVMPSADRRDKKITAFGKDRTKMLEIMIKELFSGSRLPLTVSDFELKISRPTVTYDTLRELKQKYPDHKFHFVIGSDLIDDIYKKWVKGKKLADTANFIIIKDPFTSWPPILPSKTTVLEDTIWTDISSTFVRKLIAQGHSGLPYITKGVSEFIKKHYLYLNT